jgi:predicted RNA-binding Zn-ribbon protein involved in translation (DUF1610 family)
MTEWDFEKNSIDPFNLSAGSGMKVWWKCSHDHEWEAKIQKRTLSHQSCPKCSRLIAAEKTRILKLSKSGSLADKFPTISSRWNHALNGGISPDSISSNSHKVFWWECKCGNSFEKSPNDLITLFQRGLDFKCPKCQTNKT